MKIFDITSKQRITNVPRDDISLRPDMYPCSLCWKDNVTLIIGWGTSVKVCLLVFLISPCCYRATDDGPKEWVPVCVCVYVCVCGLFLKSLLHLLWHCLCSLFWSLGPEACGILVPWPGIRPAPLALEGQVPTTGPPRKSKNMSSWMASQSQNIFTCILWSWHKCEFSDLSFLMTLSMFRMV